ncbi:hypothetical protein [Serratia sp. DD3]|uniref:hypothetical protein n=1 Tax=Serratia sp. DD3 TaxID=1410619 RepID=UPI0003C4E78E|nr:hypothetical protein [Serratia sp. DD3]KEY59652.1 hypothetical protein SRDD_14900 [Serratia sp. DD3]
MSDLIDRTPLTAQEVAFQCLALTHAALFSNQQAIRETLLFILLDRVDTLYEMLPEQCTTCSEPATK